MVGSGKTSGIVLDVARQRGGATPSIVTLHDDSRFHNDGAMSNVTWTQLPSGLWVMSFNGTTSLVDCGSDPSFNMENTLTAEAWVRRGELARDQSILSKYDSGGNQRIWNVYFYNLDDTLTFVMSKNGLSGAADLTTLQTIITYTSLTDWLHIIATYRFVTDGTSQMRLYVNGGLVRTTDTAHGDIFVTTEPVRIGCMQIGGANSWLYEGQIATPRIYNYALNPAQVRARFTATRRFFGV